MAAWLLPLLLAAPMRTTMATAFSLPLVSGVTVGRRLSDWKGQGLSLDVLAGDGPILRPFNQFRVTARVGWTAEGMLAQIHVVDSSPMPAEREDQLYEGDSAELLIQLPGAQDMVQLVVSPGTDAGRAKTRIQVLDYRGAELKQTGNVAGKGFAAKTADGYVADLFLPWSNLNLKPEKGAQIGLRVSVNDAGPTGKTRLTWIGSTPAYSFFDLSPVTLSEKLNKAVAVTTWAAYSPDLLDTHVNCMAEVAFDGARVEALEGNEVRAASTLHKESPDGPTVARLHFPAPIAGQKQGPISFRIQGQLPINLDLPDILAARRSAFQRSGAAGRTQSSDLGFHPSVFAGDAFPPCGYRDQMAVEKLVGSVAIETTFFDANGNPVTAPHAPGRYGAVAKASSPFGGNFTSYRTLFRRTDQGGSPSPDAVLAAATFENRGIDPDKADRDYWHALRKRLGTAVHYETFVKTPADYERDPAKKWPLIVYLHGSGGGDAGSWEGVKASDGPQGPAHSKADFPFIVVSLRSPGGWYPPAVQDAIDEVESAFRIDKDRIYLTGFSLGGMGTWAVAYDRPDRFAAIAPVGARTGNSNLMPLLRHVPAWVFNGAEDSTTTPRDAKIAVKSLRDSGGRVKYTEIPHAGHVDSLRYAYKQDALYRWLLSHKRMD